MSYHLSYRHGFWGYRYRIDTGSAVIGTVSVSKKKVDSGPWCQRECSLAEVRCQQKVLAQALVHLPESLVPSSSPSGR